MELISGIDEGFVYSRRDNRFKGLLIVKGLRANAPYMLCINGKTNLPGNDLLKKYGVWGSEGYYDFKKIFSNARGIISTTFEVELEKGEYFVQFALKDIEKGWKWIEIDPNVHFWIE